MNVISGEVLFTVIVISGVAMLQFYKGRKINLAIIQTLARGFEANLKPVDKLYTWIGGYSGFKASYEVEDKSIKNVELTLTLLPRQSFFWLLFSFLFLKGDRLYIVLKPKSKIERDVHIIRKFFYNFGLRIKERKYLKKESNHKRFYFLYEDKKDIEHLLNILENSIELNRIRHIALVKETNIFFCLIKPDINKTPEELKRLIENFSKLIV